MAQGPAPQGNQVPPSQDDALRQQLTEILGEILTKAQEIGFELATLDPSVLNSCPQVKPLVDKTRELIVALKKLFALRGALGR